MTAQIEIDLTATEEPRRVLPETLEGEGIADEHVQHIRRVLEIFIARGRPFTVHHLHDALCEATQKALTVRLGTLGATMANAKRYGLIRQTGRRVESPWKTKHSRKVDEWEGT